MLNLLVLLLVWLFISWQTLIVLITNINSNTVVLSIQLTGKAAIVQRNRPRALRVFIPEVYTHVFCIEASRSVIVRPMSHKTASCASSWGQVHCNISPIACIKSHSNNNMLQFIYVTVVDSPCVTGIFIRCRPVR